MGTRAWSRAALAVAAVLLAAVPAGATTGGNAVSTDGFTALAGTVRCAAVGSGVACRSVTFSGALALLRTGEPRTVARAALPLDVALPALKPGAAWKRSGVACAATLAEVRCTNRAGAAIVLSREGVAALGTPARTTITR